MTSINSGTFYWLAAWFQDVRDVMLHAANSIDVANGVLPPDFLEPQDPPEPVLYDQAVERFDSSIQPIDGRDG